VIQSAPVGILEVDLESRVIRWNPAAERIFGWSPEEILGRPVPIVPPSKQAEFEDVLATVRSGRRYPNVETYRPVSGYLLKDRVSEPHAFADAARKVGREGPCSIRSCWGPCSAAGRRR
jgi:PAS domain-containing protein